MFKLNHTDGSAQDIFGKTKEELKFLADEDLYGDYPFAVALMDALNSISGVLVGSILGGILGRQFDRPSEVVEYVVNTVPREQEDARKSISMTCMMISISNMDSKD